MIGRGTVFFSPAAKRENSLRASLFGLRLRSSLGWHAALDPRALDLAGYLAHRVCKLEQEPGIVGAVRTCVVDGHACYGWIL